MSNLEKANDEQAKEILWPNPRPTIQEAKK
jgi:hypothetical protein